MYTVSKGPSKIVAKTRRGLSQNLERLDSRKDHNRKSSDSDNGEIINMPKPVFHSNGKKTVHQRIQHHVISPQHEEIIRFISETWTQTANGDSEPSTPTSTIGSGSSSPAPPSNLYYQDDIPSPVLNNFKPFDLETWWGKKTIPEHYQLPLSLAQLAFMIGNMKFYSSISHNQLQFTKFYKNFT